LVIAVSKFIYNLNIELFLIGRNKLEQNQFIILVEVNTFSEDIAQLFILQKEEEELCLKHSVYP
jgi:hypothetical protein